MKLSTKSDYALRALLTLVENYGGGPIPVQELARRNNIPKRYLEHILLELKGKGWIRSVPGRRGGYILSASPEQLSMGQVVRYFDGILAPIACVSASGYKRCSEEATCSFRRILLNIRNEATTMMDNATLARVCAGEPVLEQEVFGEGLLAGAGI